jgi:hypothetical protein
VSDAEVKIIIKAITDQARSAMKALNTSVIGLNAGIELGQKAAQALGDAYNALIGDTQQYAQDVRQLMRVSGQNAEMTSRMIELTDDFGLSQEALTTAMRGAATKGIAFTVDNLAALSDEYLKLAPGVERNTFLLDSFGRAGLEMAKVMEQGSKAIQDQSASIDENMLMTEDDIKASESLRIAQDNLNDSMTAYTRVIGTALIPKLVDAADATFLLLTMQQKLKVVQEQHAQDLKKTTLNYAEYVAEQKRSNKVAFEALPFFTKLASGFILNRQALDEFINSQRIMTQTEWDFRDSIAESDRRLMQWGGTLNTVATVDIPNTNNAMDAMAARYTAQAGKFIADTQAMAASVRGDLSSAFADAQAAADGWIKGAGGDIASELQNADLSTGQLNQALIALDGAMGTNTYTAKLQQDATKKIIDEYKRTGDISAFQDSLGRLKNGGFIPLTEAAVLARVRIQELYAELMKLDGQTATAYVNVIGGSGGKTMTAAPAYVPGVSPYYIPPTSNSVAGGVTPISTSNSSSNTQNVSIIVNGAKSPGATADAIALRLASYGKQYQGG